MNNPIRSIIVCAGALLLAAGAIASVEVGRPAPAFSLTDTKGKAHNLADYAGRTVVLEWVNLGCPFVKKHYASRNMQKLQSEYTGQGVVWLSICSSAKGQQGNFTAGEWNKRIEGEGIESSAVLIDEPGTVGRLYGAKTTPHMFVIDPKGILAYNGAIDDKATTDVGDIARAKNFVVAAVTALAEGKPVEPSNTRPYGCAVKYQ